MPKVTFIAKLFDITISSDLEKGDRITPSLFISNNSTVAKELLRQLPVTRQLIGEMEYEALVSAPAFVYATHETKIHSEIDTLVVVNNYLRLLQTFLTALWVQKDNSVNTELGFAWAFDTSQPRVSSNARVLAFSKADNSKSNTIFSREEMNKVRQMFRNDFVDDEGIKFDDWDFLKVRPEQSKMDRTTSRWERTWFSLQLARSTSYLPSKVAEYCSCLESLLSSDAFEIAHKISERASKLLGSTLNERLEIYNNLKRAYEIRSRTVHGSVPNKKTDEIEEISKFCDNIIRRLFIRNINDEGFAKTFRLDNKEFERWLIEITLA